MYHSIRKNRILHGEQEEIEEVDEEQEISRIMHQGIDIGRDKASTKDNLSIKTKGIKTIEE